MNQVENKQEYKKVKNKGIKEENEREEKQKTIKLERKVTNIKARKN